MRKKKEEIGRKLCEIEKTLILSTLDMKASTKFYKIEFYRTKRHF